MKLKSTLFFLFLFSLLSCGNVPKNKAENKVVAIADGDTFTLLTADNKQQKIRLYGIDCPERNQDFGTVAKQKLSELIFDHAVKIVQKDIDRYGRMVALVYTDDNKCVNEEMLKSGLAWHYTEYDKNPYWDKLEDIAREQGIGLWKQKSPTPPWLWRKQKRGIQAK
ncbi:MAG TPA: thermonuclease family protein [Chitinophagaceae bacterium]|nr:thermonuclease family protein [Chitinophagaceae bacterium]